MVSEFFLNHFCFWKRNLLGNIVSGNASLYAHATVATNFLNYCYMQITKRIEMNTNMGTST